MLAQLKRSVCLAAAGVAGSYPRSAIRRTHGDGRAIGHAVTASLSSQIECSKKKARPPRLPHRPDSCTTQRVHEQ